MRMGIGVLSRLSGMLTKWLTKDPEHPSESVLLLNFDRLSYELRPGDVILVEGRSKVAEVIKMTTQNPWTHAALYIGRLYEIEDEAVRNTVSRYIDAEPEQQLLVETLLDQGTVVYPLEKIVMSTCASAGRTAFPPRMRKKSLPMGSTVWGPLTM